MSSTTATIGASAPKPKVGSLANQHRWSMRDARWVQNRSIVRALLRRAGDVNPRILSMRVARRVQNRSIVRALPVRSEHTQPPNSLRLFMQQQIRFIRQTNSDERTSWAFRTIDQWRRHLLRFAHRAQLLDQFTSPHHQGIIEGDHNPPSRLDVIELPILAGIPVLTQDQPLST